MMKELIEGFGMTTYILIWVTSIIGLLKWKGRIVWLKPKYHFICAVLTIIVATGHLILIELK